MEQVKAIFTPAVRQWLYGVFAAVSFALGVFGVLSAEKLNALMFVVSAILLMANLNTNRAKVVTPDGVIHDTPSVPTATDEVVEAESDEPLVTVKEDE